MEVREKEKLIERANKINREVINLNPDAAFVIVTKTQPIEVVQVLWDEGYRDLGENRVEQFVERQVLFPEANWHFIGPLRRKNVAKIVGKAALIHSIDSIRLLEKIERSCESADVVQDVLLQVNISGEEQKQGFPPGELKEFLTSFDQTAFPHVFIKGFMTMAPFVQDEEILRSCFSGLRQLRDEITSLMSDTSTAFDHLSMGMSNDYRIALKEGATIVRIGTAVFKA